MLLAVWMALAAGARGATLFDEVLTRLNIDVLPVRTNADLSADYLLRAAPGPVRFRAAASLSPAEARALLPTLVVDDPDTGLNTGSGRGSKPTPGPTAPSKGEPPEPKAQDSDREAASGPPEPVTQMLRSVRKPNLVAPAAPVVEPRPPKVNVVESPPPLAQIYEESRRERRNRLLRNLVPYFLGNGTNTATNSTGVIGMTNSLVPFAPPLFDQ